MMADSRVHIMRRKADSQGEPTVRKKLVDFLRLSGIIDDKFSGSLEIVFNQGGIIGSRRIEKDPL